MMESEEETNNGGGVSMGTAISSGTQKQETWFRFSVYLGRLWINGAEQNSRM